MFHKLTMGIFVSMAFAAIPSGAVAQNGAEEPIITFKTNIYDTYGAENRFHITLGSTETDYFDVDCGFGMVEAEVSPWAFDQETQSIIGTPVQCCVNQDGLVKIYGDPTKIDYIDFEGCYIDWIEMDKLVNLEILDLSHNELKRLDLSPFEKLYAIYLSDNPFTAETPLKVGSNHPALTILELDIIDHMDQSFNLSDYPSLVTFDGYHNFGLYNIDPTGCPDLQVMSLELSNVSSLDVSKNPKLMRLNISETRIRSIDVSKNTYLQHLFAQHVSGTINTDVKIDAIDVTHNPNLVILNVAGNNLTSVDVTANPYLTHLTLRDNHISEIDLSQNKNLYLVDIANNDFTFATLPAVDPNWGEYYYFRSPLKCDRSYEVGKPIDFSADVLRPNTETTARVFRTQYDGEPVQLEESDFTFSAGKITFNQVPSDSVYVEFANSAFEEYTFSSGVFKVKSAAEMGQPSDVLSLTVSGRGTLAFKVGVDNATPENPREFFVQVGDGARQSFSATSVTAPGENNVSVALPAGVSEAKVSVFMPEGSVLTALEIADMPVISSMDLTRATELRTIKVTGCALPVVDMRYNRCLTDIDLSHNSLDKLDLSGIYGNYEKFALRNINASHNKLTEFTVVDPRSFHKLDLSWNLLTELSLKNYDNLKELDLSHNEFTDECDLTYMGNAVKLDLSHNNFTSVVMTEIPGLQKFDLSDNRLTLGTVPYLPGLGTDVYVYAPQKDVELMAFAPAINLSEQNRIINGEGTTFVWKKASDGTPLVQGTEVDCQDGATRFLDTTVGKVYCEMTHPAFPAFTGANVFRTTETTVTAAPTKVVASFTTTSATETAEVIFRGNKTTALYIDWRGDGSEYKQYPVSSATYISYPGQQTYEGADVKVYTYEDASDITVFSIYDAPMKNLDLSALTNLSSLSIGDCGIDEDNIIYPAGAPLKELNLSGNNFSTEDFSKFNGLTMLNLSNNAYETFDAGKIPTLETLSIDKNKLTSITLDNPSMWGLGASGNLLTDIDLSNAKNISQLVLANNQFSSINLTPIARRLRALNVQHNNFTFATLPRVVSFPSLTYFTYANQAEVQIECVDGKVDLSAEASVEGMPTEFAWYLGEISYDEENEMIIGELLDGTGDNPEYTVDNGVVSFHSTFEDTVRCLLTNPMYPNLILYTSAVTVDRAGVENVAADAADADAPVDVYTLSGVKIRSQVAPSEATAGLAPGIYIVGTEKVAVK